MSEEFLTSEELKRFDEMRKAVARRQWLANLQEEWQVRQQEEGRRIPPYDQSAIIVPSWSSRSIHEKRFDANFLDNDTLFKQEVINAIRSIKEEMTSLNLRLARIEKAAKRSKAKDTRRLAMLLTNNSDLTKNKGDPPEWSPSLLKK